MMSRLGGGQGIAARANAPQVGGFRSGGQRRAVPKRRQAASRPARKRLEDMSLEETQLVMREYPCGQEEDFAFISYSHRDRGRVYLMELHWMRMGYNTQLDQMDGDSVTVHEAPWLESLDLLRAAHLVLLLPRRDRLQRLASTPILSPMKN